MFCHDAFALPCLWLWAGGDRSAVLIATALSRRNRRSVLRETGQNGADFHGVDRLAVLSLPINNLNQSIAPGIRVRMPYP